MENFWQLLMFEKWNFRFVKNQNQTYKGNQSSLY